MAANGTGEDLDQVQVSIKNGSKIVLNCSQTVGKSYERVIEALSEVQRSVNAKLTEIIEKGGSNDRQLPEEEEEEDDDEDGKCDEDDSNNEETNKNSSEPKRKIRKVI